MEQLIDTRLLEYFDPKIRPFVEKVQMAGDFSILPASLNIWDACSGCPQEINQRRFDRFKLTLPYAGQSLTWEVIFDCTCPEEPPDFIFGPDDEDFLPPMEEMESLSKWDHTKKDSLLLMIRELLCYYRQHNNGRAARHVRLQQDLSSVLGAVNNIQPNDLELYITGNETRAGSVYMVVGLHIDFSQIPAYLIQSNPGEDQAILCLAYSSPDSGRVTPTLHLSPRVENALGGSSCLRIPSYTAGTLLGDYVKCVVQLLENKITNIVRGFEKRKEYIAAFLSQFGRSVIEYDLETFSQMTFLFEWNDFFFTYSVDLPLYFPSEQPKFFFQSVYHEVKGQPYNEVISNFPYSPRWGANEMASRAKTFILDHISKFQRASVLARQK